MRRFGKVFHGGFYRSRKGIILGVCRGIAEYFDFSIFWTRIIAVALLLISGFWPVLTSPPKEADSAAFPFIDARKKFLGPPGQFFRRDFLDHLPE